MRFTKVFIWGHPLGSHTHSYIHNSYAVAFRHLGYEVEHMDGGSPSEIPPGSLVFTEGQVDQHVPVRDDLHYVLHNCDRAKYESVQDKCVWLGVLAAYNGSIENMEHIEPWAHWDAGSRTLFQPWGTNLLPHEINLDWVDLPRRPLIHFVGTVVSTGMSNNWNEVEAFARSAERCAVQFHVHGGYSGGGKRGPIHKHAEWPSEKHHRLLVQESYVAPTIQGKFQVENGYIPCRPFKNISYGHVLVANSAAVRDFFYPYMQVVYNENCFALFNDYESRPSYDVRGAMEHVRDNHTFVQRIETIMEVM